MTDENESEAPERSFHPNMREVNPKEGGLSCFISQDRLCGPDCMAFLPQVPEGKDFVGEQWAHCMLLANVHRSAKHLVIIASEMSSANADARRKQNAPKGG